MSYENGLAAINLEMPSRIPRTEYSVEMHFDLVEAITGIKVGHDSDEAVKKEAFGKLHKLWHYDFFWGTAISTNVLGDVHTDMGHAEYQVDGVDRREVGTCPFREPEEVLRFDPFAVYGERDHDEIVAFFEQSYRNSCANQPDGVNMTGIYITMISGLLDIFGWDMLLLACGTDPVRFGEVANRYSRWIQQYFDALADADVPVVMVHDDMVWTSGAIFKPDWYREYVFPNLKRQLAPLVEAGKKIMFTSDGDYTAFIDDVAGCGVNGFVLEPMTDMALMAEKYGKTHVIVGNADTRILLNGSKEEIKREVERCIAIGRDCPGYFLAVGNHIPPNTPVEAALYYNACYEKLSRR